MLTIVYPGAFSLLAPGDNFPAITLPTVQGENITLPDDLAGSWAYIAFYRGHW